MTRQRKLTDGTIVHQAYYRPTDPRDLTGKTRQLFTGTWTPDKTVAIKEEENFKQVWQKTLTEINSTLNGHMTVSTAYAFYYRAHLMNKHEPRTVTSWQQTTTVLKRYFRNIMIKNLSVSQIESFALQYSNGKSRSSDSAVNKHLMHLNSLLDYAVHEQVLDYNPLPKNYRALWFGIGIRQKMANDKTKRAINTVLEPSEILALRHYFIDLTIDGNNVMRMVSRVGILITSFLGLRPAELQAIRPSDIIWDNSHTQIRFSIHDSFDNQNKQMNGRTKTGNNRETLYLPNWATDIVMQFIHLRQEFLLAHNFNHLDDPILLTLNSFKSLVAHLPLEQHALNDRLKSIAQELDLPRDKKMTMYWLRHSVATELASKANGKYAVAAQLMGHSVTIFMERYVHSQKEEEEKLAMTMFS